MKLWKRAAGAFKDRNSIWAASLSRRTSYRNPDLEAAVIKATSHDESYVDYRNAQRVFAWIRASPISLKPLIWALSNRMEKTKSWVVALKGLMLMHGVFCCKTPAVQRIGRLPFDLSHFSDGHSAPEKAWGFDAFVRVYFAFLDQKSALFYDQGKQITEEAPPMMQELLKLKKWQILLDILLQIKPQADDMRVRLILEAMDCVIIEIFDVYSSICDATASVLLRIYSAGKAEAAMALKILQKATAQGDELSAYFEFYRDFGVFNAMEVPKVTRIPEEDIRDLERIINGVSEKKEMDKAVVVVRENYGAIVEGKDSKKGLRTIVTDKWEVFDEDSNANNSDSSETTNHNRNNPFEVSESDNILPLVPVDNVPAYAREIPDLITF